MSPGRSRGNAKGRQQPDISIGRGISHGVKKPKMKATAAKTSQRIQKKVVVKSEVQKTRRSLRDLNRNGLEELTTVKKPVTVVKNGPSENIPPPKAEAMDDDLNEYERLREENIRQRLAMFEEMNMSDVKDMMGELAAKPKKPASSNRGLTTVREKEILPRRKSARIAGGKVPEIERFVPLLESAEEVDNSVPLTTLPLSDTVRGDATTETKRMSDFLEQFVESNKGAASRSATLSVAGLAKKELVSARLDKLTITEDRVAKVVPERIFSIAVHPSNEKVLVAAGDKWGSVGLWDVMDTRKENKHGVYCHTPHSRPVNWMTWDGYNPNNLVTTSYDGTSRIFDIETLSTRMLYGDEEFLHSGGYTTAHAQVDAQCFLIARGKTGNIGMVDLRQSYSKVVQTYQVCEKISPKCLDVHPLNKNIFLSANNKGGAHIFDTRNPGKKNLMDPVCRLDGHSRSVSSARFSPITGNKVITISFDDNLRLFDTSKLSGSAQWLNCKSVRHNNQTGRWLTPFKAGWHPLNDDLLLTGSMSQPREIEAWWAGDNKLEKIKSFRGEALSSICCIVDFHPRRDVVIGGNASGRVYAFM